MRSTASPASWGDAVGVSPGVPNAAPLVAPEPLLSLVTPELDTAPRPRPRVVGRQGIFTADGAVHGHEFLYRTGQDHALKVDRWSPAAQDRATMRVLGATFTRNGPGPLLGGRPAFVNCTRSYLTGRLPLPPSPEHLVVEAVETVRVDAAVLAGVRRLRDAGYALAIDDFVGLDSQLLILPHASYVKVDLRDLATRGPRLLDLARSHGALLVAERIETAAQWDDCVALGFDLFQGNLLEPARVLAADPMTVPQPRQPADRPGAPPRGTAPHSPTHVPAPRPA